MSQDLAKALLSAAGKKSGGNAEQTSEGYLKDIMPCKQIGLGEGRYFLLGSSYKLFVFIVFGMVALILSIYILIAIGLIGQQMTQRGTAVLAFCMSLVVIVLSGVAGYRVGGNMMRKKLDDVWQVARGRFSNKNQFDDQWKSAAQRKELCKARNITG